MYRKCFFSMLFIGTCFFPIVPLSAQVEGEIIIGESVGNKIDRFEEIKEKEQQKVILDSSENHDLSSDANIFFTIRLGQGGFKDSRSDIGKLGGGQLTLDIKHKDYPFVISISNEYYTNSADPTHSYEIRGLLALNFLYMVKPFNSERVNLFAGGGVGGLEVPKGPDDPDTLERGIVYNAELGINTIVFWKMGIYGVYKYLYAKNDKVIDFSEHIVLLGITFNFSL